MLSLQRSILQVEPTFVRSHHSVDRIGNEKSVDLTITNSIF
jgi:hypothetical protein